MTQNLTNLEHTAVFSLQFYYSTFLTSVTAAALSLSLSLEMKIPSGEIPVLAPSLGAMRNDQIFLTSLSVTTKNRS